jgi:hypothetical protein
VTLPRQQAADAAIDTACSMPRLPSIRSEFTEIADRAMKDQMTYRGFLDELLMAECDDRARRRSERRIKAATEATMKGYRVRYTFATKLVHELVEAAGEKQLNKPATASASTNSEEGNCLRVSQSCLAPQARMARPHWRTARPRPAAPALRRTRPSTRRSMSSPPGRPACTRP